MLKKFSWTWFIAFFVCGILLAQILGTRKEAPLTFSAFVNAVEAGQIKDVTLSGNIIQGLTIRGHTIENKFLYTTAPAGYDKLLDMLLAKGVTVTFQAEETSIWSILNQWAPTILMVVFFLFFMRMMQGGNNKALSFGKSRAKLQKEDAKKKVTFKNVAGVEEAKEELQEIIDFLREPQKFQKLGARIPKGVLLIGAPGTGKTLLARAVAGEANVPFFSLSGSDFVEMFVGVGASRVRDLFEQGKKNAPCIIFIDEIDAVGRQRGAGLGGGHDEREQTLNQLLTEMDGFESNDGVIIVAATNRPDVLDSALLRPGRFDRRVVVPRPDVRGREGILNVHIKKIPQADDVNIPTLAKATSGFTGADLESLVNEAALLAARNDQSKITMKDLDSSIDKVLMGAERKSMIITPEEKRVTAYHEAGHALLAASLEHADPLHKVTIIPRGMALGLTQQLPAEDKHNWSKKQLEDRIAVCMGGRIAEDMIFDEITTGAANDMDQATEMANNMACRWGMTKELGVRTYGKTESAVFLGRDFSSQPNYSEATAAKIDTEVKRILQEQYERASKILQEKRYTLEAVAQALLERETLDGKEVLAIIAETKNN